MSTDTLKRKVGFALVIPLLLVVSGYLASIIFIVWNWRGLPFMPLPWTIIDYWREFGSVQQLRPSFLVSAGVPTMLSAGVLLGLALARPRKTLYGDGRWANLREIEKAGMLSGNGLVLGEYKGKIITAHQEHHVQLAAPTGAGKGVAVVLPNLLTWDGSVVVNDVKGENFEMTSKYRAMMGHEIFVFNPADNERRTHRWNPFFYVSRDPMLRGKGIQRIAAMLWPPTEDKGEPFKPGARSLFTTLALWHMENELDLTLPNVAMFGSTLDEKAIKKAITERSEAGNPYSRELVSGFAEFFNLPDKFRESVRGEFNLGLEIVTKDPLLSLAVSGNDFDVREFRKKRMSLYVVTPGPDLGRLRPLLSLLFQQIGAENTEKEFGQEPDHKHQLMLLLDEFTSLGDLAAVVDPIAYYRSYGLKLVTIYQSQSQVEGVYGEHRSKTFGENHKTRLCFTPVTMEEAKAISEELPKTTSFSKSKSGRKMERKTHSENEAARALMLPDEVKLMPDDEALVFAPGIYPAKIRKLRYYENRIFIDRFKQASPILAAKRKPVFADYKAARLAGELKVEIPQVELPAAPEPAPVEWAKEPEPTYRETTADDLDTLAERPLSDIRINGKPIPEGPVGGTAEEKREYATQLLTSMFGDDDGADDPLD